MTIEEMQAELEMLRTENATLRAQYKEITQIKLKVSVKGAVSAYLPKDQRCHWPVTLYKNQFDYIFAHVDEIKQFIKDHAAELIVYKRK